MNRHPFLRVTVALTALLLAACPGVAQTVGKHPDIQNIGSRDLTAEMVIPITPEKEALLGADLAKQFEPTVRLLDDPLVAGYIARIGEKLVRHSDLRAKGGFNLKVVHSAEPDLVVLPGGHVYLNSGLIAASANEAELAAALSNAIAHVAARHTAQVLSQAQSRQIAAIPVLVMAWHWSASNTEKAAGFESSGVVRQLKAEYDSEADELAIQYLWNTGYDPAAYVSALEKTGKDNKDNTRVRAANLELNSLPDRRPYIVNTSEFDLVRAKVRQ